MDDKWAEYTQFKDTVHGYIKIHKPLAKKIINTREFQRLKNVEQTGMGVLYPSATHNRFIHSLGVYHLGTIAFQNFKENIRAKYEKDCYYLGRFTSDTDAARHWYVWEILFKLACLLHDIGHTPFSHSLEILYDADYIEDVLPEARRAENSRMNVLLDQEIKNPGSKRDFKEHITSGKGQHERMSAHLILTNFGDNHGDKPGTDFKGRTKDLVCSYVHAKCPDTKIDEYIPGYDFEDDLEFMARMIVGCLYKWESNPKEYLETRSAISKDRQDLKFWTRELQLRNCIIKMLHSSLDVDNLDYATRDMQCSGYANALVDIERLLNSFTVIEGVNCNDVEIDFTNGKRIHNPVSCTYFCCDDKPNISLFGKHNVRIDKYIDKNNIKITDEDKKTGKKKEKKAEYRIAKEHKREDGKDMWTVVLSKTPKMEGKKPKKAAYIYLNGEIKGRFEGKIYGKSYLSENENANTEGITRFFEFAFDKTSQSVIDGAVFARNYEYLWIYAHHTITYQTNYLTMHMLKQYCEILHERNKKNILVELLEILATPSEHCIASSGDKEEAIAEEEIDVDNLFYKLFSAILALCKFIAGNESDRKKVVEMAGKFLKEYEDSEAGAPDRENLKSTIQQIHASLESIPKIKGQKEYILAKSIVLYINLNAEDLKISEDIRRKMYLKKFIDWIILLLGEYYGIRAMHDTRNRLVSIFTSLLQLMENTIKNENTDDCERVYRLLVDASIRDQKLRLSNGSLKYMCDVIAMLDKKTINNSVFFRSSDNDLDAYYRSLENELSQKKEVGLTSHEKEFLAVADEYFSRNFATAMWKTYTEYSYFFRNWKDDEKGRLAKILYNFHIPTRGGDKNEKESDYNYFVLSKNSVRLTDYQKRIYKLLQGYGITRFIFVRQSVKAKALDPCTTFFAFKDTILRFRDIELFNKQKFDIPFFYFYYKREDGATLETGKIVELLEKLHDMVCEKADATTKTTGSGSGSNDPEK
jgi:HD superfamily phosphohydrolase